MARNDFKVNAVIIDVKSRVVARKLPENCFFDYMDILAMVGGDYKAYNIPAKSIEIGGYIINNPVYLYNRKARLIPLPINKLAGYYLRTLFELRKSKSLLYGNVVFIEKKQIIDEIHRQVYKKRYYKKA